ncbi:ThiF family adenylyltransferase [Lagierella sp.]|uniref:ThiF family adenylyltransferase n=1 Tax=Lagierella sp. TaxID=2849657 RepID=UPI002618D288|nr:ThiF family adenylyltransferase [Lagierella sp.]
MAVDFDLVDETNLNRQILYREKHIGVKKTEAAKDTVNEFNSNVDFIGLDRRINSVKDLEIIINLYKPNCLICAADKPPVKIYKWVNEACIKNNIPYIYGGNTETTAFFQTVIPHTSSCFECYEYHLENNFNKEGYAKYLSILKNSYSSENNCTAASSSALAAFMIFDFIRLIAEFEKPLSLNKRTFIDFKTDEIDSEYIPINKNCPICSVHNFSDKEV